MIVFCSFQQMHSVIELGKRYGFKNSYPIFFIKNTSSQVLKANMKIVGATQKPVNLLKTLIEIFTDEGDVVIDPCCGSGSTLRASAELNRKAFGFEVSKEFYNKAKNQMLNY